MVGHNGQSDEFSVATPQHSVQGISLPQWIPASAGDNRDKRPLSERIRYWTNRLRGHGPRQSGRN